MLPVFFLFFLVSSSFASIPVRGLVLDAATRKPVAGASVTLDGIAVRTDHNGEFDFPHPVERIAARAPGYRRAEIVPGDKAPIIELKPFTPKGLYLSFWGAGHGGLRGAALKLIEETELNTLVIDVKGDQGLLSYPSAIPMAGEIGAQKTITLKKLPALVNSLKEKGIYTIARVVVFKDTPLASARPELAVRRTDGTPFTDREGLGWVDPFFSEIWDYNIAVAEEAARMGFDEVQFDYVRFPDTAGLVFSQENTEENRVAAISGFLARARERLAPYNVFTSADIFGYVCWNTNDTSIGQSLDELALHVDYLAPMLYPSGFQYGVGEYKNPVKYPYEMVYLSLRKAQQRSGLPAVRFRPWLQAFRDYAFDRRHFKEFEIAAQIEASRDFGSNGWMLWNASNTYQKYGLMVNSPSVPEKDENLHQAEEDLRQAEENLRRAEEDLRQAEELNRKSETSIGSS
jgi:hypothetical protein